MAEGVAGEGAPTFSSTSALEFHVLHDGKTQQTNGEEDVTQTVGC